MKSPRGKRYLLPKKSKTAKEEQKTHYLETHSRKTPERSRERNRKTRGRRRQEQAMRIKFFFMEVIVGKQPLIKRFAPARQEGKFQKKGKSRREGGNFTWEGGRKSSGGMAVFRRNMPTGSKRRGLTIVDQELKIRKVRRQGEPKRPKRNSERKDRRGISRSVKPNASLVGRHRNDS